MNLKKYDGIRVDQFQHYKEISSYNNNYFVGLKEHGGTHDLLFGASDDLEETAWYVLSSDGLELIGYSDLRDKPEVIHYCTTYT